MATEIDTTAELEAFHAFLGKCLAAGKINFKLDDSVAKFRAYQHQLERFRSEIAPALDRANQGDVSEFDIEEFLERKTREFDERRSA